MALLAQPDYEDYPGNHGISIFLNDPAHPGQLRAPVTYLPANPTQFDSGISVGNFTGTKSLDIVTTTAGNYGTGDNVLVLPSDPAHPGAFLPFTSTPLPANSQIFGLVTSDLNGDGYADVAVADEDQTKAASENPFFVGVLRPSDAGSTASFSDVPAGPSHPEFAHLQYAGGDDFLPSNSCSVDLSVFAPAVPTLSNVSAAPASPTSEDISFTGTGIERYVSYGTTKAMANVIETSNPGSPVVLRGLSPGTLYYYQLSAVSFASGCTPVITSSPMGTFTTEQ